MDKDHLGNKKLTRWKDSMHTFNQFRLIICEFLRPFFLDYLVYGSADPILQDFEEKKKKIISFF